MPRRLYIPKAVVDSISDHIRASITKSLDGFLSASEDEDTMTGHLGACLRSGPHNVQVTEGEVNGIWKWSIDYVKFRGRGRAATESHLGADGIFELRVAWGPRTETKSLLFQSKLDWSLDRDLVKQAILLSTWREAAVIFNYTAKVFEAFSIDSVLSSKGKRSAAGDPLRLEDALTEYFLQCKIGNADIVYDARTRRLSWRDVHGVLVATQFSIPKRIRIDVQSPTSKQNISFDKLLRFEEIHAHRMEVEPQEVLTPLLASQEVSAKDMKRILSMAYHPDRYAPYEQLFKDVATKRMQEINAAYDEVTKKNRN